MVNLRDLAGNAEEEEEPLFPRWSPASDVQTGTLVLCCQAPGIMGLFSNRLAWCQCDVAGWDS